MPVSLGRILQSTPLFALEAVVLDTETTGLDPRTARIIEIGAVTLGGGRTTDRTFHSFVGLAERIPAGATAVHGITDEDIAGAPPFIRVYEDLRRFVGRRVVIGHTLGFDLAVLKAECERTGSAFHSWPTLDARMLAEIAAPTLASFSVDGLAAWLQVTVSERHRAIADAQITAEIFLRLVPKLRVSGLRTYGEAARACSRLTRMLDHHHQAGWVEPTADLIEADRHEVERRLDSYPYRHRVLDVMTRPPSFANESDALRAVLARMMDARLSSLLIGSPDAPAASAGIVTERDILMAIRERGPATLDEPVETLATRPLITVPADAFVYRAIGRMRRSHIRHLAAVADDGRIIGVLSARDLLRLRADAAIVLGDDLDEATDVPALARAWAKVPAILVEIDLGHGVWIDVGERRLVDHPAGGGNVVALVGRLGVGVVHGVREAAAELLGRHPDGPLPVRRVAERRVDGAEQWRRHAQHALHGRRRQADAGRPRPRSTAASSSGRVECPMITGRGRGRG